MSFRENFRDIQICVSFRLWIDCCFQESEDEDYGTNEEDYFMFKVFRELEQKKIKTVAKEIPVGTVFPGFKTIHIQKNNLVTLHFFNKINIFSQIVLKMISDNIARLLF